MVKIRFLGVCWIKLAQQANLPTVENPPTEVHQHIWEEISRDRGSHDSSSRLTCFSNTDWDSSMKPGALLRSARYDRPQSPDKAIVVTISKVAFSNIRKISRILCYRTEIGRPACECRITFNNTWSRRSIASPSRFYRYMVVITSAIIPYNVVCVPRKKRVELVIR